MILGIPPFPQSPSLDLGIGSSDSFTKRGSVDGLDSVIDTRQLVRGKETLARDCNVLGGCVRKPKPLTDPL